MGRTTNRVARGFGSAGAVRQRIAAAALACAAGLALLLSAAPQAAAQSVTIDPTTLTVADDGSKVTYTVVLAGVAPTGNVTITMTRTGANSSAISVSPSSLTFTPGNWLTSRTVTVTGVNDRVVNDPSSRDATITHTASGANYAGVTGSNVTVTVTDDDAPTGIRLSVSPDSVPEAGGAKTMRVTATVQGNTTYTEAKTVTVSVGGGTADSGDYTATNVQNITISARTRSATGTFTLTPTIDGVVEGSESVVVSGSSDVTVTSAVVLIHEAPALSIADATANESDGTMRFAVTLAPPSDRRITVRYATSNASPVSARAGRDYTATSGTLAFPVGRTTATFTVPVRHDVLDEGDNTQDAGETFTVRLSGGFGQHADWRRHGHRHHHRRRYRDGHRAVGEAGGGDRDRQRADHDGDRHGNGAARPTRTPRRSR